MTSMTSAANTIDCRMLCACGCAYGIDDGGNYSPLSPYTEGVGWDSAHPPQPIVAGAANINACLVGVNHDDGIIVAFRGTVLPIPVTLTSILDWWQDIIDSKPRTEPHIPGKVHCGFADAVETLWQPLIGRVNELRTLYPEKRVYLTGHSKGGPMATISAARMHFDPAVSPGSAKVFTFASPHPGDSEFTGDFPLATIPVTRYENHLDIVPLVPPTDDFIDIVEKIPLIGDLFKKAAGWDYAALGTRLFIDKNFDVLSNQPDVTPAEFAKIALRVIASHDGLVEVAMAHLNTCHHGYMSGTCPTGVCS